VLGSLVLGSLVLGSLVLGSLVLMANSGKNPLKHLWGKTLVVGSSFGHSVLHALIFAVR
jgi:hypothetical protein